LARSQNEAQDIRQAPPGSLLTYSRIFPQVLDHDPDRTSQSLNHGQAYVPLLIAFRVCLFRESPVQRANLEGSLLAFLPPDDGIGNTSEREQTDTLIPTHGNISPVDEFLQDLLLA
jgi:hypothetical protein